VSTCLIALDDAPDIPVNRMPTIVGRDPDCGVRLDSVRVSWYHCCVAEVDGEVLVCDLGSTHGIKINGRRVESGNLRPGDELSIAHLRYRVAIARIHRVPC
jgi:pSer/pThr/pTyr-binding forkhead associated (FHA) protein